MKLHVPEIITLDFETYYSKDYTLTSLPTSEYVLHPEFHAHCVAIKEGTSKTEVFFGDEIPKVLASIDWSQRDLLAHNCAFDGFILTQRYGHKPRRYLDTLSMSRAVSGIDKSNRLGDLADRYNLGFKNTAALLNTKGKLDLTLEELTQLGTYCAGDVDLCFMLFIKLISSMPAREMELVDLTLRMFCEPRLRIDIPRATEALQREYGGKVAALFKAGVTAEQLMSNTKFAQLLESKGVKPPMKVSPTTGKTTHAFAKTDVGMKNLLEHPIEEIRDIAAARLKVKSTIGETRAGRLILAGKDGRRLPVLLNYCGAHTTRWSAGNKMNMQNLPRPEYDAKKQWVPGTGELRRSILAPEGEALVIADSSQIEARINAWFCDADNILKAFKEADQKIGPDVYRIMAAALFNTTPDQVTPDQRQVGKVVVLALGYGMGAEKLQTTALNGKPPVKLSAEFCERAVHTYRRVTCRPIADTWEALWSVIAGMASAVPGEYKCISWGQEHIMLPNGLKLHYPNLTLDFNGQRNATFDTKSGTTHLYGGLLLENIIQALARCVVASQMLDISRLYPVVMMAHDEIVCSVPLDKVEECKQFMLSTMRTAPSWAPGLPLNAEVQSDTCYSK